MISVQELLSFGFFYASYLAVAGVGLTEYLEVGEKTGLHALFLAVPPVFSDY